MKTTIVCFFLVCLVYSPLGAQPIDVQKLMTTTEIKRVERGEYAGPSTLVIDEVSSTLLIAEGVEDAALRLSFSDNDRESEKVAFRPTDMEYFLSVGNYLIGSTNIGLIIREKNENKLYVRDKSKYNGGISFIKKISGQQYIVFFVNEDGIPGAADTTGKVYKPSEAMAFLKNNYYEKYIQSLQRARELGLEKKFLANEVLVWGKTYYSTPKILNAYWGKTLFLNSSQLFYDNQGNAYQFSFDRTGKAPDDVRDSIWRSISYNGNVLWEKEFSSYSTILSTYSQGQLFTTSTYVGFGGNIYFYVAGEDYTEIFRIRRTWGDPDMYAMAINGYTKDEYGKYVDGVLKTMSKDDLRLLRNHVFALYGYEFKDEGLKKYFDDQVWYLAKSGVTTTSIALPAERAALVERIQAEEKKR